MSVRDNVYCGPYILAKNKDEDITVSFETCLNESCKNFDKKLKINFCSLCGSKIQTKEKIENRKVYAINVLSDEYIDKLFAANYHYGEIKKGYSILCPNQSIKGIKRNLDINLNSANVYEFDKCFDTEQEIELMQNQYHKEIEFLINNKFELSFHWGLIIYFT